MYCQKAQAFPGLSVAGAPEKNMAPGFNPATSVKIAAEKVSASACRYTLLPSNMLTKDLLLAQAPSTVLHTVQYTHTDTYAHSHTEAHTTTHSSSNPQSDSCTCVRMCVHTHCLSRAPLPPPISLSLSLQFSAVHRSSLIFSSFIFSLTAYPHSAFSYCLPIFLALSLSRAHL